MYICHARCVSVELPEGIVLLLVRTHLPRSPQSTIFSTASPWSSTWHSTAFHQWKQRPSVFSTSLSFLLSTYLTMPKTRRSLPKKMCSENANSGAFPSSGRLCEEDVRKIFTCVREGRVPTDEIAFNIVKTTDKRLMLSPPSFEFRGECICVRSSSHDMLGRIYH